MVSKPMLTTVAAVVMSVGMLVAAALALIVVRHSEPAYTRASAFSGVQTFQHVPVKRGGAKDY